MAKKNFTETLRQAVRNAPVSRYQISKDTGISQGNLSGFLHGERGLSMPSIDLLCDYLGLSLVESKRKGR